MAFESEGGIHHASQYDGRGRLVRACLGQRRTTRATDESLVTSTWRYDSLGRLIEEQLPGMSSPRVFTYIHGVDPAEVGAAGDGVEVHLVTEADGGTWQSVYDFAGRPVWTERPDATAEQRLYTGSLLTDIVHYDCLSGSCDEEVAREERSYDGLGRLVEVLGPYDPAVVGPDVVTTSTWSDAGRLLSVEDALGQRTRWSWSLSRPTPAAH